MARLSYRAAHANDVFDLMRLYQTVAWDPWSDRLMLDYRRLQTALGSDSWIVGVDSADRILTAASLMHDREQRLCKLHRIYIDPQQPHGDDLLRELLSYILETLAAAKQVEVLYTTTWKLSLRQIELSLAMGFAILGIFPNVLSADITRLNAIAGYYFGDVLKEKRPARLSVHPAVKPFFDIVGARCGITDVEAAPQPARTPSAGGIPTLEAIEAPHFVARRFERLKERHALASTFYPFQEPNVVITAPDLEIEIFVRTVHTLRFAMVIGERMEQAFDATALYRRVAQLLYARGITSIEIINDAADVQGADYLVRAGYVPSVYFPGLKRQGEQRRDYVVFGKSVEKAVLRPRIDDPVLASFWTAHQRAEQLADTSHVNAVGATGGVDSDAPPTD